MTGEGESKSLGERPESWEDKTKTLSPLKFVKTNGSDE